MTAEESLLLAVRLLRQLHGPLASRNDTVSNRVVFRFCTVCGGHLPPKRPCPLCRYVT